MNFNFWNIKKIYIYLYILFYKYLYTQKNEKVINSMRIIDIQDKYNKYTIKIIKIKYYFYIITILEYIYYTDTLGSANEYRNISIWWQTRIGWT